MIHLPRNSTVQLPVDAALFQGLTPQTGQAGSLTLGVVCLDNARRLDFNDGTFKVSPTTATTTVSAVTNFTHWYNATLSIGSWPRGHYRARIKHTDGREFHTDFSVGLHVPRALGYSAVYDGSDLSLSVWVTENGVLQTDYSQLKNPKILDATGQVITGGTLTDNSSSTAGIFRFTPTVDLDTGNNYVFSCTAVVAGPAGISNFEFPLAIGMARP